MSEDVNMAYEVVTRLDNISRADWLALRRQGIGGSDASVIMGANRFKSVSELYLEKMGKESLAGKAAEAGHRFERPVAEWFAQEMNSPVVHWPVLLRSTENPWQLATPDFFIADPDWFPAGQVSEWSEEAEILENGPPPGITAILEVKTTGLVSKGNAAGWANGKVPTAYEWQGCHYSSVTALDTVTFAAFIGQVGLNVRHRTYTPEQIDTLTQAEREFWKSITTESEAV